MALQATTRNKPLGSGSPREGLISDIIESAPQFESAIQVQLIMDLASLLGQTHVDCGEHGVLIGGAELGMQAESVGQCAHLAIQLTRNGLRWRKSFM
jgi:hypothetical protein